MFLFKFRPNFNFSSVLENRNLIPKFRFRFNQTFSKNTEKKFNELDGAKALAAKLKERQVEQNNSIF